MRTATVDHGVKGHLNAEKQAKPELRLVLIQSHKVLIQENLPEIK